VRVRRLEEHHLREREEMGNWISHNLNHTVPFTENPLILDSSHKVTNPEIEQPSKVSIEEFLDRAGKGLEGFGKGAGAGVELVGTGAVVAGAGVGLGVALAGLGYLIRSCRGTAAWKLLRRATSRRTPRP